MRPFLFFIACLCAFSAAAVDFDSTFENQTLVMDLTVTASREEKSAMVDSVRCYHGWWGRRVNLDKLHYPESLEVVVTDVASGDTIYRDSKYAMFGGPRAHQATIWMPKPKHPATVTLIASHYMPGGKGEIKADLLLTDGKLSSLPMSKASSVPFEMVRTATQTDSALTIAVVAEGYRPEEMPLFLQHVVSLDSVLFSQPGFASCADHVNVVAIKLPSEESGVSRPSKDEHVKSALGSHFDSFGLGRLLTIDDSSRLWQLIEGLPVQHIIVLANTDVYGGSGSYNDYCIGYTGAEDWPLVVIHEFGHSFIGLADEYEAGYDDAYLGATEPIEPNITNLRDFRNKWPKMIERGEATLIEGAGYQSHGVWRGWPTCLMRAIDDRNFCPVCNQAIRSTIGFYTQPQ